MCLPINDIDTYEKQLGIAAGWGKTETGDLPDTLRYVELNIVPNVTCVMNLAMVNIDITDKMICTFKGNKTYTREPNIVELRSNSSPHSVPGRARTQTQVIGPKTQFKLGLE